MVGVFSTIDSILAVDPTIVYVAAAVFLTEFLVALSFSPLCRGTLGQWDRGFGILKNSQKCATRNLVMRMVLIVPVKQRRCPLALSTFFAVTSSAPSFLKTCAKKEEGRADQTE